MAEVAAALMPHHRDVPHQIKTRIVGGNDDHAGAQMRRSLGVCDGHADGEGSAVRRGSVPFLAVDDVIVAVLDRCSVHHDRIGAGHFHLGHGKAAADPALHQRPQVFFLLFLGAEFVKDLHIARVRRLAVEGIMPDGCPAQSLRHQAVFHQIKAHAAVLLGLIGRPQLHLFHHFSFLFQHRFHLGEVPGEKLVLQGDQLFVHELIDHAGNGLHFVRYCKIHMLLLICR